MLLRRIAYAYRVGSESLSWYLILYSVKAAYLCREAIKSEQNVSYFGINNGRTASGGRADIAYVVFGSMVRTSVVTAPVGFVIPWLVYLISQDPAAASNLIVTTIKDVSGLLIYFGLATLLVLELGV